MPTFQPSEKRYELQQKRASHLALMRETVEKCERENRSQTKEEADAFSAAETEARSLAERISQIDRINAIEGIGHQTGEPRSSPLPHEDVGNAKGRKYSILRAIKCLAEKRPLDGLEAEVSQEIGLRSNKSPQGFFMPTRTSGRWHGNDWRSLDSTAGTGSVPTILDKDWIDLLRNKMQVVNAGAQEIHDLQGKFAIPRLSAAATAYWVAESGAPTGSNQTLDQVLFTPHTIGAFTDISRRFFELTILDSGEELVKDDLTAILARGVDLAALNGSGASNQPLGLMQNSAITTNRIVALGAAGGAPTWASMVEMHTIVARGNAVDLGGLAYLGNADVEGTLATTPKTSTWPMFLLEDGKVYGKPFLATQQLPNNLTKSTGTGLSPVIYGAWKAMVLAYWTGIDILVDPYTGSSSGTVRVVALQDMDIQVRHNEAFSFILDMVSNQTS